MKEFFWKIITKSLISNKHQRKNFYKSISKVGIFKYLQMKKMNLNEEQAKFKYNVSIMAIAKNEGIYFKEWIEYHKLIGIEHFYIYNNETQDDTKEVLAPYIESGLVTWIDFPGRQMQAPAYNDAISKYKNETKWMCALDLDEFIVLKKHNNINEFMQNFNDCYQVSLRWMLYGSSGHVKQPQGLVIENFTKHAKECSDTFKSIFNPRLAIDADLVHNIIGVGKWVDENKVEFGKSKSSVNIAQINHYYIKSKEEFVNRKVARGSTCDKEIITDIENTFTKSDVNDVDDDIMKSYVQKLKEIMN